MFALRRSLLALPLLVAALLVTTARAAPEASPASDAELKTFARKLADASSEDDRRALIAQADPQWIEKHQLRDELAAIQFQHSVEGDYLKAESVARLLLELTSDTHDEAGTALAKVLLGGVLRDYGEYTEAITLLDQSLEYYHQHPGNSEGLVRAEQATGIIYLLRSDFSRALAHVNEALTLAQRIDYKAGVIPALNTTGEIFRTQGQPQRALEFYTRARKEVGDDAAWNMAYIFNNIGQAYEALGETGKAVEFINRARAIAEKMKMRPRVATSLAVLGNLHLVRHELAAARQSYEQSLALSTELRDRASEARAQLGLARCDRANGDHALALEQAEAAAKLYRTIGDRTSLAAAETERGRALRAVHRSEEARGAFESAIAEIEQVRADVAGSAAESESFFSTQVAPYEELVSMFVETKHFEEALGMAERASARTLFDIVAGGKPDIERSMNETERGRERALDRKIAELNRASKAANGATPRDEGRIAQLERELSSARTERDSFQAELLASHPDWKRAVSSAEAASAEEIKALSADDSVAYLKFVATETETFLFVLRGGSAPDVFRIALAGDELARRVRDFRTKLAARALDWQEPSRQLYATLLKESESTWQHAAKLVILPDGPLWELPFQVLQKKRGALLEQHTIRYAPSLTFLARNTADRRNRTPTNTLFAVGDPALSEPGATASLTSSDWQPLPATGRQLAELGQIYGDKHSRLLLGNDARESRFKSEAAGFDVIHFATHGVINDQAPLYSYLLFAQTQLGPDEDGLLEARELMQLNLPARLAVLAACETGRGRVRAGEGMIGLSWAFLVAGCPTTVVTQWKVDSESNAELMVDFHRRLHDGAAPADALQAASLALAKKPRYRHPFYWAPFVVIGTGR